MIKQLLSSTLLLLTITVHCASFAQFKVQAGNTSLDEAEWFLLYNGKRISPLKSIGGSPSILKTEPLASPPGSNFLAVYYHAGSAGTQVLSYVDRMMILLSNKSQPPKVLADFMLELVREKNGEKSSFKRTLMWSKDRQKLTLDSLDEESAGTYTWNGKSFHFEAIPAKDLED